MIAQERLQYAVDASPKAGRYVLYWMQQAQRTTYNHALEYAIQQANELHLPLVTCFVLTDRFPEENLRHYAFMLEGLQDIPSQLQNKGVQFILRKGHIPKTVLNLATDAALLVTDMGYLRIQREWRRKVAESVKSPFVIVESDVVVPVQLASSKEEFAARTLRPKLLRQRDRFLKPVFENRCQYSNNHLSIQSLDIAQRDKLLQELLTERTVLPVKTFKGGQTAAKHRLKTFIREQLCDYHRSSNDPVRECQSHLSPYLHFGHISPVEIALEVMQVDAPQEAKEAFLEQLIIRRELSINFVYYNPQYDSYKRAVPEWALKSLKQHQKDTRPYIYTLTQMERGETHDIYWNAAQMEMVLTGKMHNYMRMYWGKKIIEWNMSPEEAFQNMLYLNNTYELDGRDPNGFTGVAWCFGKHDRPWKERPVFGKVRYMNAAGLERKFDMSAYVKRINNIC
jgi:deoxyribodipyrimidine photo-lyase